MLYMAIVQKPSWAQTKLSQKHLWAALRLSKNFHLIIFMGSKLIFEISNFIIESIDSNFTNY